MKKLLIASWNPWKIEMFKNLLSNHDFELIFLSDLDIKYESPEENWHTVQENSYIKAKYFWELTWFPTLWDDAWLEIKALWWEPWVKARRWAWLLPDTIWDDDWLEFFHDKIKHIKEEKIEACFPFSRCLYLPWWKHFFQVEKIDFIVSKEPRKNYHKWFPLSSVCVFSDWRHQLDISPDDPIYKEQLKKEWLLELLKNLDNFY